MNHSIIIDDKELKRYSQNWHRPAVAKDLDRYDFTESETNDTKIKPLYEPRGAQIEALCALEDTRAEGAQKALIQAATQQNEVPWLAHQAHISSFPFHVLTAQLQV